MISSLLSTATCDMIFTSNNSLHLDDNKHHHQEIGVIDTQDEGYASRHYSTTTTNNDVIGDEDGDRSEHSLCINADSHFENEDANYHEDVFECDQFYLQSQEPCREHRTESDCDFEYVRWADILRHETSLQNSADSYAEAHVYTHSARLEAKLHQMVSEYTDAQLIIPEDLMRQAACAAVRLAAREPYGLNGADLMVTLERHNHTCIKLGSHKMNDDTITTFHLNLTIFEDLRLSFVNLLRTLANRFRYDNRKRRCYLLNQFHLEKLQLYRTAIENFELNHYYKADDGSCSTSNKGILFSDGKFQSS